MQPTVILIIAVLIVLMVLFVCTREEHFQSESASRKHMQTGDRLSLNIKTVDGSTNVRSVKGNSGKTVILLHNSPFDQHVWDPLFYYIQELGDYIKVPTLISYDLKGHGTAWIPVPKQFNSPNINHVAWTLKEFAANLLTIYKQLVGHGKVVLVGYGFGGTTLAHEVQTLASWVGRYPDMYYLTLPYNLLRVVLCKWFSVIDKTLCPDTKDTIGTAHTPEFMLAEKMMRESSATTLLQTDKLASGLTLLEQWTGIKVDFPIYLLSAKNDPLSPPNRMVRTFTVLRDAHPGSVLDIVEGKHGLSFYRPDYIAGIICGACPKANPLSEKTLSEVLEELYTKYQ